MLVPKSLHNKCSIHSSERIISLRAKTNYPAYRHNKCDIINNYDEYSFRIASHIITRVCYTSIESKYYWR